MQRGFIDLGLGAALVAAGLALLFLYLWQGAVEREAKVRGEYYGFVEQQKKLGLEAAREAAEKDGENYAVLAKQNRKIRDLTNRAVFAERELRERPSVRPDGSIVPETTCAERVVSAPAGKLVPAEDYRALELRAFRDTRQCVELQQVMLDWEQKGLITIDRAERK